MGGIGFNTTMCKKFPPNDYSFLCTTQPIKSQHSFSPLLIWKGCPLNTRGSINIPVLLFVLMTLTEISGTRCVELTPIVNHQTPPVMLPTA